MERTLNDRHHLAMPGKAAILRSTKTNIEGLFFHNGIPSQKTRPFFGKPSTQAVQRRCSECEKEQWQRKENNTAPHTEAPSIVVDALRGNGTPLDSRTQSFMSNRFGYDFNNVRIHNNTIAVKSASSINAHAYTSGNNIVFNSGQYQPDTPSGKKLLAHELTHVVQQSENSTSPIQRTVRRGTDHAGSFQFDDQACTMNYDQNWYFHFQDSMTDTQRNAYMARAESQVESTWSHAHRLRPRSADCPCHTNGVDVTVDLHTSREDRQGRDGYTIDVNDSNERGLTTQPTHSMVLSPVHDIPQDKGASNPMPVIAHEFGHTLGITDEYHGWNHFWDFFGLGLGADDKESLMNLGDQVRPRHYQHFADLISNVIENCQYQPQD